MIVIMSIVMTMLASGSPCHYRSSSLGWGRTVRKKTGHRACFLVRVAVFVCSAGHCGGKNVLAFRSHSLTHSITHSLSSSSPRHKGRVRPPGL